MSWFINKKDGTLSGFRVASGLAVFGVVLLLSGYLLFGLEVRNAQQPLNIDIPPNTELMAVDETNLSAGRRIAFYKTTLSPEEVAAFYDQKLADFQNIPVTDIMRERCRREPRDGDLQGYTPGNGSLPYRWKCLFDNSRTYDQLTTISIYPGQRNDSNGENYEGVTRIDYEQIWQP